MSDTDALRTAAMKLWAKLCHDCYAVPGTQCDCVDDIVAAFKEIVSAPGPDVASEALADIATHRDAWREALLIAQRSYENCSDDYAYWTHELKVFDRTFDALATKNEP